MSTAGKGGGKRGAERGLGGCCWKSTTLGIPVAVEDAPGGEGRKGGVKRRLDGLCAKSASLGIPVAGQDAWPKAGTGCVVGCCSKSAGCGVVPAKRRGGAVLRPSAACVGCMRHFVFHETFLGMRVRWDCYPFEVDKVDEGSAAHDGGVPKDCIIVRVNGRSLSPTDSAETKAWVRKELKETRPLSFAVVLRCAAGVRSVVGGLPAVPGKTEVAGGDAAAGVGRGTLRELICSLPGEEQETVARVLRRLVKERGTEQGCVQAVLRRLAGSDSEMCVGFCVHAVVVGASYVLGGGVGGVGWDDGALYGAMGAVMECV